MQRRRKQQVLAVIVLALGAAGAAMAGSSWWIGREARGLVYEQIADVPARTVAIVPGARVWGDRPSNVLADRLATALDLYRTGRVRRILVSGDHREDGYDEVNVMHAWLRARDVPDADIFLDHAGIRTLDTMQRAARIFHVRDAVVCTQRFHLARSLFLARHAGIDAVGAVADRRIYQKARTDRFREAFARTRAMLDVYVLATEPRFLGAPIPIDGDARLTHDAHTQRR